MTNPAPAHRPPPAGGGATYLLLVALVMIWAVNFTVAKAAMAHLTPLAFNALRFPLAGLVVFAFLAARGRLPHPAPGDRVRLVLLGVLGNVVYQLLFIYGLANTRAGTASIVLAGTPMLTALLSAAVGHERIDRRVWIGVLSTMVGIALVVVAGGQEVTTGEETLVGDVLMVGASFAWAGYTVGSRNFIHRYGPVALTGWTLWVGGAGLVVLGIPDLVATDWSGVHAATWAAVFYSGAFSIGAAYLIWYTAVRSIGNTRTATFTNLVPAVALAVAWLGLGEVPTLGQLTGAGIIIAGVTLAQVRSRA